MSRKFANFTLPVCPEPLLEQHKGKTGDILGRYSGVGANKDGPVSYFPCSIDEWVYAAEWKTQLKVPNYLSILSVILCLFLLLSFAVLPL
ncbi:hypothetical protein GQ43DRAFT_436848 [Delitschia confertaspora ATCC 74209]|uniref:Uncharacterized protein n=1 Tax=Delitschia confertaspora ATCC 74209 TaxID=1513339 RepID=A0A9P4JWA4_9PLEO|nr:hypothetical protein GQ43DRAFT_436848 [Delitschia confertaspora ATCC 74209]